MNKYQLNCRKKSILLEQKNLANTIVEEQIESFNIA